MQKGQSLIEILISIAIAAVIFGSVVAAISVASRLNLESKTTQVASLLARQTIDSVESIAESNWQNIYGLTDKTPASTYYATASGTALVILPGSTTTIIEGRNFNYWFSVENVNRASCGIGDATTSLISTPSCQVGTEGFIAEDPSTQKITATVTWQPGNHSLSVVQYTTRKRNNVFIQSDWSGGDGQATFPSSLVNNKFFTSTNIKYGSSSQFSIDDTSASGTLTSSIFDTNSTSSFNSVMWQGIEPDGTNVRFQIAASNCSNGASNPPTCDSGSWAYWGPDGSDISYYSPPSHGVSTPISPLYTNNKKYIRYKAILEQNYTETVPTTGPIDLTYRWAWGDNIGWIDFGYAAGNVQVNTTDLSGYAWSDNVGEIALNCSSTPIGDICGTSNFEVFHDAGTGDLSGWAWNDVIGWIRFNCDESAHGGDNTCVTSDYKVTISPTTGIFSGWAWNDIVGWISFNCTDPDPDICGVSDYKVSLSTATSTPVVDDVIINWSP
ncbi:MAG: prepilin-type N-terminal cleavage/methylation domain-containing protein [Candidatus Paceibacterota bacterium]|jgi:hypothetical protein